MADIVDYQARRAKLKTVGDFKLLGRELRDKFGLTDRQAIDILNDDYQSIKVILTESLPSPKPKEEVEK